MGSAAKKLEEDLPLEAVDQPSERELKLAGNFEDPALGELIPITGEAGANEVAVDLGIEPAESPETAAAAADGFENLPIPEEALAIPPSADAPKGPRPLPQTVNPNPDPLERSLLMQVPTDGIEDAAGLIDASKLSNGDLYKMCEQLFELVVCERNFADLVDSGLRAIMKGLDAKSASILEIDHQREDFFFRASVGGSPMEQLTAFRVPLNKGIVGHVAESGQPLLIRDLAEDQMQLQAVKLSLGFEAKTCMAAPILVGGQPYGVIELFNKNNDGYFDEKDLAALEEGVRMFAKVLEVRFLLAELSRRIR